MSLLEISRLQVHFRGRKGVNRAVDGVSFSVNEGETLAIVGESGSGKSVVAMSILGLLPKLNTGLRGEILFNGSNLLNASEKQMRSIRGNSISMVFQEPMMALNPVMTIGRQISETLMLHQQMTKAQALERAREMLDLVRIPEARQRLSEYPHQLSGGMRQRVMIAIALACSPKLLIADEPTTALDVTIQAQILAVINELKARTGMAMIIVTHDLGVVAEIADRMVVVYSGLTVEEGSVAELFHNPRHPYTVGLLGAMPSIGMSRQHSNWRLAEIPGSIKPNYGTIRGCIFAERCWKATDLCRETHPPMTVGSRDHAYACHFPEQASS
jgi:peptide/nickel transport system ATP-binding protein